jgi:hypothetical protein
VVAHDYRRAGVPSIVGRYEWSELGRCREYRIRSVPGSGVVLVALIGFGQEQDKRRATSVGFDAHVTKPANGRRWRDWRLPS